MTGQTGKRLFRLDARLAKCASMLRGRAMADIGTDHAYLPVFLAVRGEIPSAIASDIGEGPLRAARRTIARFNVEHVVEARLSDGLSAIRPGEAEDIVIAGMGGELIARILSSADWLKCAGIRLVLQPMTMAVRLRVFLRDNGFAVRREEAVSVGEKRYTVLCAEYAPEAVDRSVLYPYVGALDGAREEDQGYLLGEAARMEARAQGLVLSGPSAEAEALARLAAQIRLLVERKCLR